MWLVIGYGNLLRADDGAGRRLAELLAQRLPAAAVRVLSVHQLTPELCLEIACASVDRVLFIDAAAGQQRPFLLHRLRSEGGEGRCGHQLSPEVLLMLCARLYGRTPRAWLLTLPSHATPFAEGLSPKTQRALSQALEHALALLHPAGDASSTATRNNRSHRKLLSRPCQHAQTSEEIPACDTDG
ncbi:hydrogenase maturation protease [Geoalkalibacter ferrihydriticus]|uniref:Hydrogenase maturation protease n=1 Tax=Geoalkalibacter ferrihydriticus TaxID=392333 RepID=A0A1G9KDX0_9BACT|nr:hydrogenase maturation protease [Geoalkalibacter ferrihydriticus]SDL47615.1 hydrogenase maturation protease [Geoalkalibacter ferrihydriticus]